jgi:cobalamin-dependent methionine synthase I
MRLPPTEACEWVKGVVGLFPANRSADGEDVNIYETEKDPSQPDHTEKTTMLTVVLDLRTAKGVPLSLLVFHMFQIERAG